METQQPINPSKILQTGTGFFNSKTLLTAVNMGLFTVLGDNKMSGKDIQKNLGLHDRSLYDFLDALVAMAFLERTAMRPIAIYFLIKTSQPMLVVFSKCATTDCIHSGTI